MKPPQRLLAGDRVRLTAIEAADYAEIASWSADSGYLRNLRTSGAAPESTEHVAAFGAADAADPNRFSFAIRENDQPDIIGIALIKDIEWPNRSGWLAIGIGKETHRGRGLGSETVGLLVDFAFGELNLRRLSLSVISYNQRAVKTYLRFGFVEEGVLRKAIERDGSHHDLLIMGLLASERPGSSEAG